MIPLSQPQLEKVKHWFLPEQPGPLIGLHVLQTGHGTCYADRWPDPGASLAGSGGNYSLLGDPAALDPIELRLLIQGFVQTRPEFVPLLKTAFPDLSEWPRLIFSQARPPTGLSEHPGTLRRLAEPDAQALSQISPVSSWIWKTWGGPAALVSSGFAWGAFIDQRLVSVACTFFLGERYEEVGVVTEPGFRGRGLSTLCAAALCRDIHSRHRIPSWTTSPDNAASRGVARKLGFALQRQDLLYAAGVQIPDSN